MSSLIKETVHGAKWGFINKIIVRPVSFVYFMVLARLITPDEMGVLGLTGIFFALASSLKEAGMGTALLRKLDRTDIDCCTVFWFNIAANVLVALVFWLAAPWFAVFFNVPDLKWITRISCIMMVLGATQSVHYTLYTAKRDFKTPTIIGICTTLLGMPVTLYLAYTGWSYWSLVISGVFTGLVGLISIWVVSPWKPRFAFSEKSFREFFAFGYKMSISSCVWHVYNEMMNFIIGKFYSPAHLAMYSRANHLAQQPSTILFDPVYNVMFPALVAMQQDEDRLRRGYRMFMKCSSMGMVWLLGTIAAVSDSLILLLYGERWLDCAPYLQILCIANLLSPVIRVNHSYICVKGRSDLILLREVLTRTISLIIVLAASCYGVKAICWGFVVASIVNVIVTLSLSIKLSGFSLFEQSKDFIPYAVLTAISNIPALLLPHIGCSYYITATIGPCVSLAFFVYVLHRKNDAAYMKIKEIVLNNSACRRICGCFRGKREIKG